MWKLFGPSLFFMLWGLGLPAWQAAALPLAAQAILYVVRVRSRDAS